ncbi:glutathione transferase GstA [Agitococcus lubricus]|uniref:Glutathione S-transferase n=1 Tax=Agitococcus lubricus TaxID=1077255 RepID=A0A2T5J0G5_9GAMM|nr:glutathione transferase GstA [Agitococcus lubricus]PTQ89833.1 glutathione S-transferase [Agitococcus lubricus]
MKLYYAAGACSLAPHIVAQEAGIVLSLERVDLASHKTESGVDFYQLNAKGSVPFLVLTNGESLSEGSVICQYLADSVANTQLLPPVGSMARYRVQEWQNYISSELHKSFSPLFNPKASAETKALFAQQLKAKLTWVSAQLANRPYLTGEHFTIADAYLFVVANWSQFVALDVSDLAPLHAFLQRVASRPAVQAALKAEGLIK